jgi:hypothetical protein
MADFYAARAGTNAGAPLDGFLTAVHTKVAVARKMAVLLHCIWVDGTSFEWGSEKTA